MRDETTRYQLHITLDQLPKSLNKTLRSHHLKNHRANKTWDMVMIMECHRKRPPAPLEKARLTIIRHSHRMLDFDGLVGSLKPVVDGLIAAGVIIDDSWSVVGSWIVDQRFRPKKDGPRLEILVEQW